MICTIPGSRIAVMFLAMSYCLLGCCGGAAMELRLLSYKMQLFVRSVTRHVFH